MNTLATPAAAPRAPATALSTPAEVSLVPRTRKLLRRRLFYTAIAAVPAALGVAVTALTRSKRAGVLAGSASAFGLGLVRFQLQRLWSDEPAFTVTQTVDGIELREYTGFAVARVELAAPDADAAMERGFDILFGYIRGQNQTAEKLEMTAPVITQRSGTGFTVSFVMPAGRTVASLPAPSDSRVSLAEVPARALAVLTYRGRFQAAVTEEHQRELLRVAAHAGVTVTGHPAAALFDPPTTAPFARRNEAWVEVLRA